MIGLGGGIIVDDDDDDVFEDFCGSDCLDYRITLFNSDGVEFLYSWSDETLVRY